MEKSQVKAFWLLCVELGGPAVLSGLCRSIRLQAPDMDLWSEARHRTVLIHPFLVNKAFKRNGMDAADRHKQEIRAAPAYWILDGVLT